MNTFQLEIITPLKKYASFNAEFLTLNTHYGEITIYAHHQDMIANVEISPLILKRDNKISHFALSGGVLYCNNRENKVQLIVNAIESYDEIDIKKALEKKIEAEKLLINAKSIKEYNEAEIKLKKAINRISVKEKYQN